MSTKLTKNVVRESEVEIDGKTLIVTMYANGEIGLKPKNTRGKERKIGFEELWESMASTGKKKSNFDEDSGPVISLYDLRHHSAITNLTPDLTAKFDGIIKSLIDEWYS